MRYQNELLKENKNKNKNNINCTFLKSYRLNFNITWVYAHLDFKRSKTEEIFNLVLYIMLLKNDKLSLLK